MNIHLDQALFIVRLVHTNFKFNRLFDIDGFVKRPILFAPQPFSGDSKGFAKSQELGTSTSNSLRFLTLNPLPLFFRKGLNGAHKSLFTILSIFDKIVKRPKEPIFVTPAKAGVQ